MCITWVSQSYFHWWNPHGEKTTAYRCLACVRTQNTLQPYGRLISVSVCVCVSIICGYHMCVCSVYPCRLWPFLCARRYVSTPGFTELHPDFVTATWYDHYQNVRHPSKWRSNRRSQCSVPLQQHYNMQHHQRGYSSFLQKAYVGYSIQFAALATPYTSR